MPACHELWSVFGVDDKPTRVDGAVYKRMLGPERLSPAAALRGARWKCPWTLVQSPYFWRRSFCRVSGDRKRDRRSFLLKTVVEAEINLHTIGIRNKPSHIILNDRFPVLDNFTGRKTFRVRFVRLSPLSK